MSLRKLAFSFALLAAFAALAGATTCGDTLSSGGTYTLTENVSSGDTCITITGNNVVLDCNGNWIIGDGSSTGVSILGANNTVVRDCNFYDFYLGVDVGTTADSNSSNLTIFNNTFDGNARTDVAAISLGWTAPMIGGSTYNISYNTIRNIADSTWSYGIWIWGTSNAQVIGNTFYDGSRYAINPYDSVAITISSNSINNSKYSIYLQGVQNANITSNTINNSLYSIRGDSTTTRATNDVRVASNRINECTGSGPGGLGATDIDFAIYFTDTVFSTKINVSSNTIYRCWEGVYLYGDDGYEDPAPTNFTVAWNNITLRSGPDNWPYKGIRIDYGGGDTIAHNTISDYEPRDEDGPMQGIYVYGSSFSTTVYNNTLDDMDEGIYIYAGGNVDPVNVSSNTIAGTYNGFGIYVQSSADTILSSNSISASEQYGIQITSSARCQVTGNSIDSVYGTGSSGIGIYVGTGSANTTINNNDVLNTSYAGLKIDSSSNISASGNYINGTQYGVTLGVNATFVQNVIEETGTAIDVLGNWCNITGNTVSATNYGVHIESSINYTTLDDNSISSDNYGLYVADPAGTGTVITESTTITSPEAYSQDEIDFTYSNGANLIDFDSLVVVNATTSGKITATTGVAAINATALPTLNTSARITMAVAGYCSSPQGLPTLYYAPSYYTTLADIIAHGQVCDAGTTPACTSISCVQSGSNAMMSFDVEHFDSYGGQGNDIPEFSPLTALAAVLLAAGGYAVARKRR